MTVQALKTHRTEQKKERLRAGNLYQEHGLVFCLEDGSIWLSESLPNSYRKMIRGGARYRGYVFAICAHAHDAIIAPAHKLQGGE